MNIMFDILLEYLERYADKSYVYYMGPDISRLLVYRLMEKTIVYPPVDPEYHDDYRPCFCSCLEVIDFIDIRDIDNVIESYQITDKSYKRGDIIEESGDDDDDDYKLYFYKDCIVALGMGDNIDYNFTDYLKKCNYTGTWISWDPYGIEDLRCTIVNGKMHGKYLETNGSLKVSYVYENGEIHGEHYQEGYIDNVPYKKITQYKHGKHHGICKHWKNDILIQTVVYDNGVRHGYVNTYYDDGKPRYEGLYVNNVLHGISKEWHNNGEIKEISNYHNNMLTGISKKWHDNGNIHVIANFLYGKLHGLSQRFNKKGKIEIEIEYINNSKCGKSTTYHTNGTKSIEEHYENDVLQGDSIEYYPNGDIMREGKYCDYKKHGLWKFYDYHTNKLTTATYDRGICMSNQYNYDNDIEEYDYDIFD